MQQNWIVAGLGKVDGGAVIRQHELGLKQLGVVGCQFKIAGTHA